MILLKFYKNIKHNLLSHLYWEMYYKVVKGVVQLSKIKYIYFHMLY